MNLQSPITGTLGQVITFASAFLPEDVSRLLRNASDYIPKSIDPVATAEFMLYFTAASLILGILSRMLLGKRSSLNHSLSSVLGICLVYAATVVVYTFRPWQLEILLSPLPFVTFAGEYLILLPVSGLAFPALCSELLALVLLCFLVNLTDTLMPQGKGVLSWLVLRLLTVVGSMALHLAARWAFQTYAPEVLVNYAPGILLGLLIFLAFSGVLSLILGLIITVSSPFLGAMYSFFFSNIVGKQLSKALFSAAILTALFCLTEHLGYTVVPITAAALMGYIPLMLLFLLLWYLIGHVL